MTIEVDMRQMRREDVPRVMEIERECFPVPWHESAYLTELANRSAYYVVACKGSEIVGYAGMWVIMDEAHITTLGVARASRGEKIGERLLIALLDESLKRKCRRATLEVRQSNEVAQNLYRKYEFIPAAVRRGYYTDNQENAVVMWIDDMVCQSWQKKYRALKEQLDKESATCAEDVV
ncbi:ribosomal protein S18-alanine N-acetyltransferase [bacterium]|nr:ribosomal protein S18-alanine N-acetyltransferase [bacterium]